MTGKYFLNDALFFIILVFLLLSYSSQYTLRVPLIAPIGGSINPMGDICLQSTKIALDKINANPNVLPGYKLVVDIIDDQCENSRVLQVMIPELMDWKWRFFTNSTSISNGTHRVPEVLPDDDFMLTPPLFVGSPCSEVCKAIGQLPQHFGIIEAAVGCVDSKLDNRFRYPNFYRLYRSSTEMALARLELLLQMKWNQVAIISDLTQYTSTDSFNFMTMLSEHNITIVAEELFIQDHGDESSFQAVTRLKNRDVRIVFAICYINTCPEIACAAYRAGFYGPTVVWIFSSEVDILRENVTRPDGCTKHMTDAVAEGALFLGTDLQGNLAMSGKKSEIGVSPTEITNYIEKYSPNANVRSAFEWRLICFESVHNAAFILDGVERELKKQNKTIADLILDKELRNTNLTERVRQSILDLNIQASWGPGHWNVHPNVQPLMSYSSPTIHVQQVHGGVRKSILAMKQLGGLEPIGNATFLWRTSNHSAPKSQLIVIHTTAEIKSGIIAAVEAFSVLLLLVTAATILYLYTNRKRPGFSDTFAYMNCIILFGSSLPLIALSFYPTSSSGLETFCVTTPVTMVISIALVEGGLATQLLVAVIFKQPGRLGRLVKMKRRAWIMFIGVLTIVIGLSVATYSNGRKIFAKEFTDYKIGNDLLQESIKVVHWYSCSLCYFYWAAISVVQFYAFVGICSGEAIKSDINSVIFFISSDRNAVRNCLYCLFPISIAAFIAMAQRNNEWILFASFSTLSFAQNIICVVSFWLWQTFLRQEQITSESSIYRTASSVFAISRLYSRNASSQRRKSKARNSKIDVSKVYPNISRSYRKISITNEHRPRVKKHWKLYASETKASHRTIQNLSLEIFGKT